MHGRTLWSVLTLIAIVVAQLKEMERMNPKSSDQIEHERQEEKYLTGQGAPATPPQRKPMPPRHTMN